jgi:hypothetical protein
MQVFGRQTACSLLSSRPNLLVVDSSVWQRNLEVMRLCGVADPLAAAVAHANRLPYRWLATSCVANRLAVQRCLGLSAAAAYEQYARYLAGSSLQRVAGRLLFLEHIGVPAWELSLSTVASLKDAAFDSWLLKRGSRSWSAFKQSELERLPAWQQLMVEAEHEAQRILAELPPEQNVGAAGAESVQDPGRTLN